MNSQFACVCVCVCVCISARDTLCGDCGTALRFSCCKFWRLKICIFYRASSMCALLAGRERTRERER
uniref:Putative secreted protein n=1 Tax=Anopheles darlingi TaxID=43151 RepID=A0A2M4DRF9_ANODA